jgi:hypothetical protein
MLHVSQYFLCYLKTMSNKHIIQRLTALWALSESGLGGMMHALKLPFTGFFLGGFAILIVSLIAHHSTHRWKDIMQATLLVVLVKAAVSPQSPPMAYLAVGFQGLSGAVIYGLSSSTLASCIYGGIALFESAIQKFITATLFFGKSIWSAIDSFFNSIAKDLGLDQHVEFSFWLIVTYTSVYTMWGIILGFVASKLPAYLQNKHAEILQAYINLPDLHAPASYAIKEKNRKRKIWVFIFILLFIVAVFVIQGDAKHATYVIARTIGVLLLLFYVIGPFVNYVLNQWLKRKQQHHQANLQNILDTLPQLKNLVGPAIQIAALKHNGIKRYINFVVALLVLALYQSEE